MGITLGFEHTDLVVPRAQISFGAASQIAHGWSSAAEQLRISPPGCGNRLLSHDFFNHLLNHPISPEKDFFCAAMKVQRLLDIDVTSIQASTAAQGLEHSAAVASLDQVLQWTTASAIGQVRHVEDHSWPRAPDRFGDQMAPMRHEDSLWIDRRYSFRGELGWFGDDLNGTIELLAESISQCAVPRVAGD